MRNVDQVVCPYCKHENADWWEYADVERDDQDFEMNCLNCDEEFNVFVYVTRRFTTSEKY